MKGHLSSAVLQGVLASSLLALAPVPRYWQKIFPVKLLKATLHQKYTTCAWVMKQQQFDIRLCDLDHYFERMAVNVSGNQMHRMSNVTVKIDNRTVTTFHGCSNHPCACGFKNNKTDITLPPAMTGNTVTLEDVGTNSRDDTHFLNICEVQVWGKSIFCLEILIALLVAVPSQNEEEDVYCIGSIWIFFRRDLFLRTL